MARFFERAASAVGAIETSKWVWATIQGGSLLASFGLTAWAAWAAEIFSQYAPLSWVFAGFVGAGTWTLIRLLWAVGHRIRVRARYDAGFLERGGNFNPLDTTFERKRIFLNDFALPSHPLIENKAFIDCDIIGPANIYFRVGNTMPNVRAPRFDAVWLHPTAQFINGVTFDNCIFRNCSFQRITMFASIENYPAWKHLSYISWISIPPSDTHIEERKQAIQKAVSTPLPPPPAEPPRLAPPSSEGDKADG